MNPSVELLLDRLHPLIERTWDLDSGIRDPGAFLIGDDALARFGPCQIPGPGRRTGEGARVLLRQHRNGIALGLYYPDSLVRLLLKENPLRSIHPGNVDAFAVFTEELDHLLVLASRARRETETSLLELELHANITKDLVLRHLLGLQLRVRSLPPSLSDWVRFHLFEKHRFLDEDPGVRARYENARRIALALLAHLSSLRPAERLAALRRIDRAGPPRIARGFALVA